MIVTEVPTLDENLKKLTPWWDVIARYLIAAMMAISLTTIAVQVTKDNLICVPAIDCSNSNISHDAAKLCQSLNMTNNVKKKVLTKLVDRRFYDYVDSVCFQELSWFTKFFPLIILVEAVILLVWDILWTKLPCSSSVLNHFVSLADEGYSSLATMDIILKHGIPKQVEKREEVDHASSAPEHIALLPMDQPEATDLLRRSITIPEADVLKVLNLAEKAEHFRNEYTKEGCCKSLYCFYLTRTSLQLATCAISFVVNLIDYKNFFSFSNTVHFKCVIDEIVFTKEYEHFECSHPLAPYFRFALILFLIFLGFHFLVSFIAFAKIRCCGRSYTFPEKSNIENGNDFAFLFYLLTKHDKLYADRVSYKFFRPGTYENLKTHLQNTSR